jgi:hypothetical protein
MERELTYSPHLIQSDQNEEALEAPDVDSLSVKTFLPDTRFLKVSTDSREDDMGKVLNSTKTVESDQKDMRERLMTSSLKTVTKNSACL